MLLHDPWYLRGVPTWPDPVVTARDPRHPDITKEPRDPHYLTDLDVNFRANADCVQGQ